MSRSRTQILVSDSIMPKLCVTVAMVTNCGVLMHEPKNDEKLGKGLFTNYVISKLTYMVLQIITKPDAIYLVGSLIMMND